VTSRSFLATVSDKDTRKMFGFGSSSSSFPSSSSGITIPNSNPNSNSNSNSTSPASPSSSDPAITKPAPNREQRSACWTSRDTYFQCLDRNQYVQAGDEIRAAAASASATSESKENGKGQVQGTPVCSMERGEYEAHCGKSWVSDGLLSKV